MACTSVDLLSLYDDKNRSLLMYAAERSCLPAIKFFIKSGFDVTYQIERQHPVDFVNKKNNEKYSEVVLELLKANSPFPKDFNVDGVSQELKDFTNLMAVMHQAIKDKNIQKIKEIVEKHKQLNNFYLHVFGLSSKNISAYRAAEALNFRDVLRVFYEKNVFPAPFEDFYDLNFLKKPFIQLIYRTNHFLWVGGEAGQRNRITTASPGSESNPNDDEIIEIYEQESSEPLINKNNESDTNSQDISIPMVPSNNSNDDGDENNDGNDDGDENGEKNIGSANESATNPQNSKFNLKILFQKIYN